MENDFSEGYLESMPEFASMEARREYLRAVTQAHDEWEEAHLADDPPMTRDHRPGSNYPLHHLTVDATGDQCDDFDARLNRILGEKGIAVS